MTRKRKQKCIKGLSASASSRLRKRLRDELTGAAQKFIAACAMAKWAYFPRRWRYPHAWTTSPQVQSARARYNRARALAAECGV